MQTRPLPLVYGIHKLFPDHEAERFRNQKRGHHVQDSFHRFRALQHAVRPPDGVDRPPADGQRPHCGAQWRRALFRALKPEGFRLRCLAGASPRCPHRAEFLPDYGPDFGAIFLRGHFPKASIPASAANWPDRPSPNTHRMQRGRHSTLIRQSRQSPVRSYLTGRESK